MKLDGKSGEISQSAKKRRHKMAQYNSSDAESPEPPSSQIDLKGCYLSPVLSQNLHCSCQANSASTRPVCS